jgi:hypothetical protein
VARGVRTWPSRGHRQWRLHSARVAQEPLCPNIYIWDSPEGGCSPWLSTAPPLHAALPSPRTSITTATREPRQSWHGGGTTPRISLRRQSHRDWGIGGGAGSSRHRHPRLGRRSRLSNRGGTCSSQKPRSPLLLPALAPPWAGFPAASSWCSTRGVRVARQPPFFFLVAVRSGAVQSPCVILSERQSF